MEALKKFAFWVLVGVVIIGAGAFWVLAVFLKQSDAQDLQSQYDGKKRTLQRWAGPSSSEVKTPRDIEALGGYLKALRSKRDGIKDELLKSNIKITSDQFMPPPPRTDLPRFHIWIEEQYKKREAEAKALNEDIIIDKNPDRPHLVGDFKSEFITQENMDLVLKRLVITRTVQHVLASVKAGVPVIRLNLDTDKEEVIEGIRRVEILKRMEFMSLAEADSRRTKLKTPGVGEKWRTPPPFPEPFGRHVFELEFVAHYSLVPEVIRGLLDTRQMYLVITRLDTYRHPQVFEKEETVGMGAGSERETGAEASAFAAEQERLLNSRYHEAPVVVILECEVLEFDFPDDTETKAAK